MWRRPAAGLSAVFYAGRAKAEADRGTAEQGAAVSRVLLAKESLRRGGNPVFFPHTGFWAKKADISQTMPPFVMSRPPLEAIKAVLRGQDGDSIKWPDTDGNFIRFRHGFFC